MSFHAMVIVNPQSANGATGRRWPQIRASLDRVLDRWDNQFTLGPGDATKLARQAVMDGYEMVISVGGDGTMNEVVTGLFEPCEEFGISESLIRSDMIIASVRQGTGGDFARFLELPHRLPEAVAHLSGAHTRPCDLGLIEYHDQQGRRRRNGFLNIASFGLSGVVDEKVNQTSKALGGRLSFMIGLGRALWSYRPVKVRIRVDDADFYEGSMVLCAVANGQYFGGGMHFAPEAELDDGLLDVVAQLESGPREYLRIQDVYSGRLIEWPTVRTGRGERVEAEPAGDDDVLLDVDGEALGRLPAQFSRVHHGVRLKVS